MDWLEEQMLLLSKLEKENEQLGDLLDKVTEHREKVLIENYELKKEITIRKQYEGFLISVIRSDESLSEEKNFEWFKEWFKRQLS